MYVLVSVSMLPVHIQLIEMSTQSLQTVESYDHTYTLISVCITNRPYDNWNVIKIKRRSYPVYIAPAYYGRECQERRQTSWKPQNQILLFEGQESSGSVHYFSKVFFCQFSLPERHKSCGGLFWKMVVNASGCHHVVACWASFLFVTTSGSNHSWWFFG